MKRNSVLSKISSVTLALLLAAGSSAVSLSADAANTADIKVDLTNLTYMTDGASKSIEVYSQDDFNTFVENFNKGTLSEVYVTEFLFDGVGMVKTPDLDDFIEEESNDAKVKTLGITAVNVNTTGNVEFSGEITGGMIAVNTNGVKEDINLI